MTNENISDGVSKVGYVMQAEYEVWGLVLVSNEG